MKGHCSLMYRGSCRGDLCSSWAPHHHLDIVAPLVKENGWTHRRQGPLTWGEITRQLGPSLLTIKYQFLAIRAGWWTEKCGVCTDVALTWSDEVVWWRRHSKAIGDERGAEVIHLIVEEDSCRMRHDFGAKPREEVEQKDNEDRWVMRITPVKKKLSTWSTWFLQMVYGAGGCHCTPVLCHHRQMCCPMVLGDKVLRLIVVHVMGGIICNLLTEGIGKVIWGHVADELKRRGDRRMSLKSMPNNKNKHLEQSRMMKLYWFAFTEIST